MKKIQFTLLIIVITTAMIALFSCREEQQPMPPGKMTQVLTYIPGANWNHDVGISEQNLGDHFKFMSRLFEAGKLVANGPYTDKIVGFYVFDTPNKETAQTLIDIDPGSTNGVLKEDNLRPWYVMMDQFDKKAADDAQFFILYYHHGKTWQPEKSLMEQNVGPHIEYAKGLFQKGTLIAGGPLVDKQEGLYIVMAKSKKEVEMIISKDPGVQSGLFSVEVHPWYVVQRQKVN